MGPTSHRLPADGRDAEFSTVPEKFWVILDFNAEQTKGVYVSYDTSTGGKHSRTGVAGGAMKEVSTGGDWMVQAILSKPASSGTPVTAPAK